MKLLFLPFHVLLVGGALLLSTSCAPAQTDAPKVKPKAQGQARNQQPGAQKNGQKNRQNGNGQNQNAADKAGNGKPGEATAFAQIPASNRKVAVPPTDAPQDIAQQPSKFPVPAGAIFAAPDARDGGAGTRDSPMTLQNALQKAPAGGTVVLRGGVYRDGGLVVPRKITLQGAPDEVAWIDGSDIVSGWQKDGNAWKRAGWETTFPGKSQPQDIDPAYPLANNRDMVWLNGRYLTQVATRAEVGPSKFWVDYAGKALFIGDDPTGNLVEATARLRGLTFRGRDAEAVAGAVVRGVGLRRFAEAAVEIQVPQIVLEGCTLAWNGRYGAQIRGGGPQAPKPADVVLRGINASCNGQAGVRTWATPRLLVENSTFSHNNVEGYRVAWGAAGIKVMNFDGLVFRNNVVADNYSFGLWLDENANDAMVVGNEFKGNEVAGLMFEISHRSQFAFNVLHDNNVGAMVSNATQGQFWNNTFADNRVGLQVKQGRRPNHQTPEPGDIFLTRGMELRNNLFAARDAKAVLFDAGSGAATAPDMISASDFNFYAPGAAALAKWKGSEKTQTFPDLAAFRAATGQEKSGTQAATVAFADAAKGDYRPQSVTSAVAPVPAEISKAADVAANAAYVGAVKP